MAPGVFAPRARVPWLRHRNYNPRHWAKNTAGAASSWARGRTGACGAKAAASFRHGDGRSPAHQATGTGPGDGQHRVCPGRGSALTR